MCEKFFSCCIRKMSSLQPRTCSSAPPSFSFQLTRTLVPKTKPLCPLLMLSRGPSNLLFGKLEKRPQYIKSVLERERSLPSTLMLGRSVAGLGGCGLWFCCGFDSGSCSWWGSWSGGSPPWVQWTSILEVATPPVAILNDFVRFRKIRIR